MFPNCSILASIFQKFPGGACPQTPLVPACFACWEVCFAHLYPTDQYLELAPPPFINPRSAPGNILCLLIDDCTIRVIDYFIRVYIGVATARENYVSTSLCLNNLSACFTCLALYVHKTVDDFDQQITFVNFKVKFTVCT